MRHYFSTRVRVVLITAVLLTALLAVISNLTGFNLPERVVQGMMTPLRAGASHLKEQAEQLYGYIFRYEALLAENIALKEKIAQMDMLFTKLAKLHLAAAQNFLQKMDFCSL